MIAKMTTKNQITIPKKILERAGLKDLRENEKYFDIEVKDIGIFLKPVTLVVEDRIPSHQWEKFEDWANKIDKEDVVFTSAKKANSFLKKRIRKS